jgi:predicted DNA-binding transcriptional regulator YafY
LDYDPTSGCYRPTGVFRPVFDREPPETIFSILAATVDLGAADQARMVGFNAPVEAVGPLPLRINDKIAAVAVRALVGGAGLRLTYQSLEIPDPEERRLHPTGLIFTGRRWLIRGWDEDRKAFRDFAIARILKAAETILRQPTPRDEAWHEEASLRLSPAPYLSSSQAAVVGREFLMALEEGENWHVEHRVRRALVPYVLDHLGLRPRSVGSEKSEVVLTNISELAPFDRGA